MQLMSGADQTSPLAGSLDAAAVAELAGPLVYERGVGYWREQRVELVEAGAGWLNASVRGTTPYSVELWTDEGEPRWSCTCPAAEDGSFCKHCVATALSLLPDDDVARSAISADGSRSSDRAVGKKYESDTDDELTNFVKGLPPDRLAGLVLEQAESDWRMRERLLAEARAERGLAPDIEVWRHRINNSFATGGFVSYWEANDWADGIYEVIDGLEDLCDVGHYDAVAQLAEHAFRRADKATNRVDDSGGCMVVISSLLAELHLRACRSSTIDSVELADRLLKLELNSELDGFHRCAARYAEVLGETGLARFRKRLEPRLKRVNFDTDRWSGNTFALEQALVGWALGTGDPDSIIEAHHRIGRVDTSTTAGRSILPDDILEIAEALERVGRGDEAIVWARRGIAQWGNRSWQVGKLRDFLAQRLRARGDEQAAVDVYWKAFVSEPSLITYQRLQREDKSADWLERCREVLDNKLARVAGTVAEDCDVGAAFGPRPPVIPDAAVALVEILLFDGLVDAAWEVANKFNCSAKMWLALARAREKDYPLDAIAVYEQAALGIISRKKPDKYKSAVDLMARVRRLADSAGEPARFVSLLERVRTEHKAKRRLKSLLDEEGW